MPRDSGPADSTVAPGRLSLLADLAGRLAEAPESPETFQAIAEGTRGGTMSALAELRVESARGETLLFRSGSERPRSGRKLAVRVRAGTVAVGDLAVYRVKPYHDADRLFLETMATHLGAALDGARLRRAERQATEPHAVDGIKWSGFGRLRGLFGGAVGRVVGPAAPALDADEPRLRALTDDLITLARVEVDD